MQARGGGVIINISDETAVEAWPGYIAHSIGKAAMLTLTRQMALELAPQVRVNAVVPGPILPTPRNDDAVKTKIARKTLLGRWGTPEDLGQAIRYLIEADYVTGAVLTVDGGEHLGRYKRQ
jgi:NAD(P)-dependent dehydrogenase (short-subunit alcohol dehydrogenase family)